MTDLRALKYKYSWGPIPQWELDRLEKPTAVEAPEATHVEPAPRRRGRPKKVTDGNGTADRDQGA